MLSKITQLTLLLLITMSAMAQPIDSLRNRVASILRNKQAVVGVAIDGQGDSDSLSINGPRHFPLQSVFKFHIALAVLSAVDEGKFSLDQKVKIEKKDLLPGLYSPIRDRYPNGTTLALSQILHYTVASSDNVGCDLLLRIMGGPSAIEQYFRQAGFSDISIKHNEEDQQRSWDLQFDNWTTPLSANAVLSSFYVNSKKLLSPASHRFIWRVMQSSTTGGNRIKGGLKKGTRLAHKTGSSGANRGITAATNDIGIIFLPDGSPVYLSVFVGESKENAATNEKIIADIAAATWKFFATRKK